MIGKCFFIKDSPKQYVKKIGYTTSFANSLIPAPESALVSDTQSKPSLFTSVLHLLLECGGFKIEAILMDNGREYCGRLTHHHYEIYLGLNDIEHRKTRIATLQTNGFAERFNRTVREEFFDVALRQKLYTSIEELQKDLNEWLKHYNYQRPHQGYSNMGRRPIETIEAFKKQPQPIRKEDYYML